MTLVTVGTGAIVILKDLVTEPSPFVALIVKLEVSTIVGVPEITPVDGSSDNPVGSVPESTAHVIGAVPVAASVWLYAVSTTPRGSDVVVMVGGAGVISILKLTVEAGLTPFAAVTLKLKVPTVVGVPEITPVDGSRLNPAGREPDTDQVARG